jgi:hypothetical protein
MDGTAVRRRRIATAVLAVLAVAALVGIGVVAWWRAADKADVLLVGDSIMRQTGPALAEELPDREVENRGVNGSGLLNPQVYDWVERLPGLLAQTRPEATVVLFIGNYAPEEEWWIGADGEPVPPNTPEFFAEWREQAELVVDRLEAAGTDIYWVLPPPVVTDESNETVDGLRQVNRDLAADHPGIILVDASPPLTDGAGRFVVTVPDGEGGMLELRVGDGVHLGDEGARRLAAQIAAAIREGTP